MAVSEQQPNGRRGTPRRARLIIAAVYMVSGMVFASELVMGEARTRELHVPDYIPFISELMLAHAVGGAIAGLICAPLIGRGGVGGVPLSVLGAVLATLLGGMLGGAAATLPTALSSAAPLVQLGIGVGLGAMTVPFAAGSEPGMLLVWVALAVVAYGLGRWTRR